MMTAPTQQLTPPRISVIIPVRNGAATLETCLRALFRSTFRDFEVVVVDDHSTDESATIASRFAKTMYYRSDNEGANGARNFGAKVARGAILVFLDADVVVRRDTLQTIYELLEEQTLDAVVGVYTTRHRHESLVSQYKNLWIRYSYLKSSPSIDWLFGAISAIKREAFEALGGFDPSLLASYGNDDIEFGKRLAFHNLRIHLSLDVEVEHLKQYTLRSFIKNEFFRSLGFAQLATTLGEYPRSIFHGFANVYPSFILSTIVAVLLLAAGVGWLSSWLPQEVLLYVGGLYFLLNVRFLNYLEQVRGLFAMSAMIPILFLDHLVCLAGSIVGVLRGLLRARGTEIHRQ